jgi:hypothetical protein
MTGVRLKYLHCFTDRHGKARYYFRYRDRQWPMPAPGTGGFATAYDALLARIKANPGFRERLRLASTVICRLLFLRIAADAL